MFCILKKLKYDSVNDSKQIKGRLTLSCTKKLSALLKKTTSKNNGHSYCFNCLHTFRIKNKFKFHEKVKDFCVIVLINI